MPSLPARAALFVFSFAALAAARAQDASTPNPAAPDPTQVSSAALAPEASDLPPLSLEACVAQALAKNFSVKIQGYPLDQAKAGVVIAQSTYDPILGVNWQKTVVQSPAETTSLALAGGGAVPKTNDQQTTLSVTQNVITGGTVTANYNLEREASNEIEALLNPAYLGNVSLTVSQPLLQGAGTDYARAAIETAQLGARIADLTLRSTVLSVIDNVETAYYNVIYARQQYDVGRDSVKLAQELYDENVVKRNTGVLTDLDVLQAETGVATAQSQLVGYKQTMENNEDLLLEAMGETEFKSRVGWVDFPALPDTSVSFDYSYKLARDNGPSLAVVEATIQEYQLDALRAKRNNLPALAVSGGAGYSSAEHSYGEASQQLWPGSGYNWQAGVSFSMPWGMRDNRALYRQAMDNVASERTTYDQTDQTLIVNVRSAVRAVSSNVEGLAAAAKASTLAQKQYELELAEFKVGLVTSYDVLQTQTELETARVSEIQARGGLYNALANLHMLEGTSLGNYHVNLN